MKVLVTTPLHHPLHPSAAIVPGESTKEGVLSFLSNNERWYNIAVLEGWVVELNDEKDE